MYETPINLIMGELETSYKQMITDRETTIMANINQQMGINIDKQELIRALNYDREQYEKGYDEGIKFFKFVCQWLAENFEYDTMCDEMTDFDSEWCANNCENMTAECWERYFKYLVN